MTFRLFGNAFLLFAGVRTPIGVIAAPGDALFPEGNSTLKVPVAIDGDTALAAKRVFIRSAGAGTLQTHSHPPRKYVDPPPAYAMYKKCAQARLRACPADRFAASAQICKPPHT